MIIRFRCYHCQHLFGITVASSGTAVDCPHCGRSLRVPRQDGIASPQRNRKAVSDRSIVQACELLSHPPPQISSDEKSPPHIQQEQIHALQTSKSSTSQNLNQALETLNKLQPSLTGQTVLDSKETVCPPREVTNKNRAFVQLSIVVLILFVLGAWWGGLRTRISTAPISEIAFQPKKANAVHAMPLNAQTVGSHCLLKGRIRYRTTEGTFLPDRLTRLFFIPESPQSTELMSLQGTKVSDSNQQHLQASENFFQQGGGFAIADGLGEYELRLPSAGKYYAVVLSANLKQNVSVPLSGDWQAILSNYFANPNKFVAEGKSQIEIIDVTEEQPLTFDLDFERS